MKFERIVSVAFVCLLLSLVMPTESVGAVHTNVILVMADDQGWGDMAYNGHPTVKTPNFDKSAASGLRFDRFYAAAPVCSPTRASVMTGRHPNRMGVFKWGYPMRPQETTIAEALKTKNYATGHFGKWHLGSVRNDSPANPGKNGFDEWYSAANFYDNDSILSRRGRAVPSKGESSIVAVDAALDWIRTVKDQPFLAVVWFGSPHHPHRAVEEDRKHYSDQPEKVQHFLGEITGMDRAYGKLRNQIRDMGIADNTILWYCSDNGALPKIGSTGGHRGNKGKVYEGGLLVPAIMEWPAVIDKPRVTDVRCNTCDIFPTILSLVGAKADNERPLDGVDLSALVRGQEFARPKPMGFWDYTIKGIGTPSDAWMTELYKAQQAGKDLPAHPSSQVAAQLPDPKYSTTDFPGHAAMVDENWKLHRIQGKDGKVKWELYNLESDPKEEQDVRDAQPERVAQIKTKLKAWLTSVTNSLNGEDYEN